MLYLKRFLDLIEKADIGIESGCQTTAKAYWRMAQLELLERIKEVRDPRERARVDEAYAWIERFTSKPGIRLSTAISRSDGFWFGFDCGQRGGTMPGQSAGALYRRGYRYGSGTE